MLVGHSHNVFYAISSNPKSQNGYPDLQQRSQQQLSSGDTWQRITPVHFGRREVCQTIGDYTFFRTGHIDNQHLDRSVREKADKLISWIEDFIAQPDSAQGRPLARNGKELAVCPAAPEALKSNSVWLAIDPIIIRGHGHRTTPDDIVTKVRPLVEHFPDLGEHSTAPLTVAMIMFPNVDQNQVEPVLQAARDRIMPAFFEKGLVPGLFHPEQNLPSRFSREFMPSQAPVPCLMFRYMLPSDFGLINKFSPDEQKRLLPIFIETMKRRGKGNLTVVQQAQEKLESLGV